MTPHEEIKRQVEMLRKLEAEIERKFQKGLEKIFSDTITYISSTHDRVQAGDGQPFSHFSEGQSSFQSSACEYLIKGNKINYCHKAMYDKNFKCEYLKNKKECEKNEK